MAGDRESRARLGEGAGSTGASGITGTASTGSGAATGTLATKLNDGSFDNGGGLGLGLGFFEDSKCSNLAATTSGVSTTESGGGVDIGDGESGGRRSEPLTASADVVVWILSGVEVVGTGDGAVGSALLDSGEVGSVKPKE